MNRPTDEEFEKFRQQLVADGAAAGEAEAVLDAYKALAECVEKVEAAWEKAKAAEGSHEGVVYMLHGTEALMKLCTSAYLDGEVLEVIEALMPFMLKSMLGSVQMKIRQISPEELAAMLGGDGELKL